MINTKRIVLNEREFEIRELSIAQGLPLMPRLSGDTASAAQIEMISMSVFENGQPVDPNQLGLSMFSDLITACMEVNGFGDDEEAGND
jgi:Fe-S-cluster formation regulator IscX/YfhJ